MDQPFPFQVIYSCGFDYVSYIYIAINMRKDDSTTCDILMEMNHMK